MRTLFYAIVLIGLLVNSATAAICLIPFLCSSSAVETATSVNSSGGISSAGPTSSILNGGSPTSAIPITSPAQTPAISMTSNAASSGPTAIASITPTPAVDPNTLAAESNTILPPATSTAPAVTSSYQSRNNHTPIIIGSICGAVALLLIAFGCICFTRNRRNKNKRLSSENGDMYEYDHYDVLNNSTGGAAGGVATQWTATPEQHYNYNTSTPQLNNVQDPYYTTATTPQMGYVDPNYYNQPYAGYPQNYEPQYQQYNSPQPAYVDQVYPHNADQSYSTIANSNVYSPPNTYDHDAKK